MDMRINMEGLEKERDFYYSKLRDIEILWVYLRIGIVRFKLIYKTSSRCQEEDESQPTPIVQKIMEILYATEVSNCEYQSTGTEPVWKCFIHYSTIQIRGSLYLSTNAIPSTSTIHYVIRNTTILCNSFILKLTPLILVPISVPIYSNSLVNVWESMY